MKLFLVTILFGAVMFVGILWALLTGNGGWAALLMLVAVVGGGALAVLAKRAQGSY